MEKPMNFYQRLTTYSPTALVTMLALVFSSLHAGEKSLPEEMQKIMDQVKYAHATWECM